MLLSYTFQIKSWFINSFTDSWRAILMNLKDESHSANRRLVASPGFLTRGGRQEKEPTKGCTGQGWTNDHIAIIFLTLKMFSQKSYSTIMIIEIRWYNSEVIYLSVIWGHLAGKSSRMVACTGHASAPKLNWFIIKMIYWTLKVTELHSIVMLNFCLNCPLIVLNHCDYTAVRHAMNSASCVVLTAHR